MDHLCLVTAQSDRNKMTPQNLAICFGPVLMLHSDDVSSLDFQKPIGVLKYLLQIWPMKSGTGTRERKPCAPSIIRCAMLLLLRKPFRIDSSGSGSSGDSQLDAPTLHTTVAIATSTGGISSAGASDGGSGSCGGGSNGGPLVNYHHQQSNNTGVGKPSLAHLPVRPC